MVAVAAALALAARQSTGRRRRAAAAAAAGASRQASAISGADCKPRLVPSDPWQRDTGRLCVEPCGFGTPRADSDDKVARL